MIHNFELGQVLPKTKYLKIAWTIESAEALLLELIQIRTDDERFSLVRTPVTNVQSDTNPLDIDSDYDLVFAEKNIVASWKKSLNRLPEWLINCGLNSGLPCQTSQFVIINTMAWSLSKRTISSLSSSAILDLTWENLSDIPGVVNIYFNSVGGTPVEPYTNILVGQPISEPETVIKPLFIFAGWYTESTYENLWDFENDIVAEEITLYANWSFDESLLDMATTTTRGAVILSDAESVVQLEYNDDVITEFSLKSIMQEIIDDFDEALDEV